MQIRHFLFLLVLTVVCNRVNAQTKETGGWLSLSHTQKISEKFDFLTDVQLRTADEYKYWRNLLLRSAVGYNLGEKHQIALGYAYFGEWEKMDSRKEYTREHRIYQQYQFKFKHQRKELSLRGRLEQRFIGDEADNFSQRARVFGSIQAPIAADKDFTKGLYVKIQDEIFFNIQNKDQVNGSILDQHRPYGALGYRTSKKLDFELGYMRLFQRESDGDFVKDIMQVIISTSF